MANDKNHLYTLNDERKDRKNVNKRKEQQQYSRFSAAEATSVNNATIRSLSPALQVETKVQIGSPYDDTKGSVGPSSQVILFNVYGSNYTFYEVTGDVAFGFDNLPTGRHIDFVIDILVNQVAGVTLTFPTVLNAPTLAGNDADRYVLKFTGVNRSDPTGVIAPVQTYAFIGGTVTTGGGVTFPIEPTVTDNGTAWTNPQTLDLSVGDGHVFKWTVDQNLTFAATVTNIPAALTQRTFELEFVHDNIGGTFTVTLPNNFSNENGNTLTSFTISSNTTIILTARVNDGTNFLVVQKNVTATSTGEVFTWTADHSAATFDLIQLDRLRFVVNSGTVAAAGDPSIYLDGVGNMTFNVPTGDFYQYTEQDVTFAKIGQGDVQFINNSGVSTLDLINRDSGIIDLDQVAELRFRADDDAVGELISTYGRIFVNADDVSSGSIDGRMTVQVAENNVLTSYLQFNLFSSPGQIQVLKYMDMNQNLLLFDEQGTPSPLPASNQGGFYVKDVSTVTHPFFVDSAGLETDLFPGSGGANTALSNLITTSINQDLLPSATALRNVGSAALSWAAIFTVNVRFNASTLFINGGGSGMTFEAPTGNTFIWQINNFDQLTVSASDVDIHGNQLSGLTQLNWDDGNTLATTPTAMILTFPAVTDIFEWDWNSVNKYTWNEEGLDEIHDEAMIWNITNDDASVNDGDLIKTTNYKMDDSVGGTLRDYVQEIIGAPDITVSSFAGSWEIRVATNGTEAGSSSGIHIRGDANTGTAVGIAVFGGTPVPKQNVTGARDDPEAALANLLSAIELFGWILDSTTVS